MAAAVRRAAADLTARHMIGAGSKNSICGLADAFLLLLCALRLSAKKI